MSTEGLKFEDRLYKRIQHMTGLSKENLEVSLDISRKWNLIYNHLKSIYGDIVDPKKSLSTFLEPWYRRNKKQCKTIFDLPKIDIDELNRIRNKDMAYNHNRDEITQIYKDTNELNNCSREIMIDLGKRLGVFPQQNSLFNHLYTSQNGVFIPENDLDRKKLTIVLTKLSRMLLDGYAITTCFHETTITQPGGRNYYRGENGYYKTSRPSLYRGLAQMDYRELFIRKLRLNECMFLLEKFDAVRYFGKGESNFIALAQHYGMPTPMMDFTSDLDTALFFACCKWSGDKWLPLDKNDIDKKSSRSDVYHLGGDSRYAVLYMCPSEIVDMTFRFYHSMEEKNDTLFAPIGYQPFMRCHTQHGYMLVTKNPSFDLLQEKLFYKCRIKLDVDFCNEIYEKKGKGELIYPDNDVPDFYDALAKIKYSNQISKQSFTLMCDDCHYDERERELIRDELARQGISIVDSVTYMNDSDISRINTKFSIDYAMQLTPSPIVDPMVIIT